MIKTQTKKQLKDLLHKLNIIGELPTEHNYSIHWLALKLDKHNLGAELIVSQLASALEISSNAAASSAHEQGILLTCLMENQGYLEITKGARDLALKKLNGWDLSSHGEWEFALEYVNKFNMKKALCKLDWKPWARGA